jgi:hypothetical protein
MEEKSIISSESFGLLLLNHVYVRTFYFGLEFLSK